MTEIKNIEESLAEQLADLILRNPQNYDVTFSVGPDKIKVKAVKIILKAASPVFEREFENKWESAAVVEEGVGIPLPDVNPHVFTLFVNLIISDAWSKEALNNLNLDPSTVLDLLQLCRRFEITKAIKNLEEKAGDFIQNFNYFKDAKEFLEVSQENFKLENHLFVRRDPIKGADEKVTIYEYIGGNGDKGRAMYDIATFPFQRNPRIIHDSLRLKYSVLGLSEFKMIANPPFVCDGKIFRNWFQVSQTIALHGFGFLGPTAGDTWFDVPVGIERKVDGLYTFISGMLTKHIFARKEKIFYFLLDKPISIEPNRFNGSWINCHRIDYRLKGTNSVSQYKEEIPIDAFVLLSGVEFNFHRKSNNGKPLVQLLYKIK